MFAFAGISPLRSLAAGLAGLLACGAACAQERVQTATNYAAPPDFSSGNAGWVTVGTEWTAVPGSPPPVTSDPAHPYVPNNVREQPTFRVADVANPNLTQFAKDELKKSNDEVLRGKAMYARESRCWATGVPAFLLNPGGPTYWLQTPDKIAMIWQLDHQVRHVYLNVPHSPAPKPSWYGESVGHYEADTLVVDTIGQNTKTFVDNYRTPHSEKLHVVERYRLIDGGKMLQADVTLEDPAVFIKPLQLTHRWRRMQGTLTESSCAEGEMYNPFKQDVEPIPSATQTDF
ncbi:MAG TPA: hypothetical protein VKW08_01010 [Xanthobacteraceae bacterium]|nr:hypothetical protein [Xanthobacteraceae bacterium]